MSPVQLFVSLACLLWSGPFLRAQTSVITITSPATKITKDTTFPVVGNVSGDTADSIRIRAKGDPVLVLNGKKVDKIPFSAPQRTFTQEVDLATYANQGVVDLEVVLFKGKDADEKELARTSISIEVDTEGPIADSVRLIGVPGGASTLQVRFRKDDFKESTLKAGNFKLERTAGTDTFGEVVPIPSDPIREGSTLHFPLGFLKTDTYRLTILGKDDPAPGGSIEFPLKDILDNPAKKQQFLFTSFPEREKGEHVEYPAFLRPGPSPVKVEGFDPGDKVDTRVIRLFYFRDAHRVVEIINRDAKQLNAAGVDREKFLAQEARIKAENLTDDRRMAEIKAIQAVARAREARHKIDEKNRELQLKKAAFEADPKNKDAKFEASTDFTSLQNAIGTLENDLKTAQAAEITESNKAIDTQAKEDRSVEEQFRREVAAAKADFDTYAKGKISSFDPVTQVSMAVIGEGLIQVRGPIKGINRIARMIHQIDTPVGQVKVGIHTVQINGEHGDRMELVYERIDKHIAHCRFLTNQSLQLFRRAVHKIASQVALDVENGIIPQGCEPKPGRDFDFRQLTRDMKYIYSFFGKDFVDELCRMESELLRSDNKLISLNSMDTMSLASALYLTALAKNDIRDQILREFQALTQDELPRIEVDYLRALTTIRCADPLVNAIVVAHFTEHLDAKDAKKVWERAARTYQFSNLVTFLNTGIAGNDTLNSVQFATIRMAQALKAQLVAEIEYRNLVVERSLLEKSDGETERMARVATQASAAQEEIYKRNKDALSKRNVAFRSTLLAAESAITDALPQERRVQLAREWDKAREDLLDDIIYDYSRILAHSTKSDADLAQDILNSSLAELDIKKSQSLNELSRSIKEDLKLRKSVADQIVLRIPDMKTAAVEQVNARQVLDREKKKLDQSKKDEQAQNKKVFAKRLLDQFLDEQDEKSVELLEAMRSHVSNVDNYLKRMVIALEDDIMAQFYNPAFQSVRRASRFWDVNFSQVETTTILTNNRAFAKVQPTATMEFDLPKRDILLKEGFQGAKALALTYGELLRDKTFLSATAMMSGSPAPGVPNSLRPVTEMNGQPPQPKPTFGAALDALIPDPAVYKFETGTGFEIRPVIQPDGQAILYNFNYMYTTNIREPIRADEQHLGRVKRHFIHTDVQTGCYELRELSRYTVALRASRTGKGVPLLQDIPGVGVLFRPLPSAESSLQQNIILASSVIYPTTYELMGLRWSPYADELNSPRLARQKDVFLKRKDEMRQELLSSVRIQVNERIGIENRGTLLEEGPPAGAVPPGVPYPSGAPSQHGFVPPMPSTVPHASPYTGPIPGLAAPPSHSAVPDPRSQIPAPPPELPPTLPTKAPGGPGKPASDSQSGPDLGGSKPQQSSRQNANEPRVIRAQANTEAAAHPGVSANPQLAAAFAARGLEHCKKKDFDRAVADCTQAVQLDPASAPARCARGVAFYLKGSWDPALSDFNAAIKLDPACATAFCNRAMIHYVHKDYARCIADSNQALRLQPNLAQAYFNRYLAHQATGMLDQARQDRDAAVRLEPRLASK